jgi:RNA polymerase sigma factor (sigma-70 family)
MKKNWVLSQEFFDAVLDWLDPDRELAGKKYEDIRRRLIKIFASRGCYEAEDLADETINRVATKVEEVRTSYHGDPALYFYGIANHVYQEYLRRKPETPPPPVSIDSATLEKQSRCLDSCLAKLSEENRTLVLQYYWYEKTAKINGRKRLAEKLGIAPSALRLRAHRIRAQLLKCVERCLDNEN